MEVKLGAHVYYIIFMTTTTTKILKNFSIITSSLLKLTNGIKHGDETWYTCVLHHFRDNYMFI